MDDNIEECPKCGVNLRYESEQEQGTLFSRLIGYDIRGVYDGVLYWACPDCGVAFHRWTDPRMMVKAQPFIDAHNVVTLKEKA